MASSPPKPESESETAEVRSRRGTLSRDTDPRAEAVQIEILRRMPSWRKVQLLDDAIQTGRALALAGLRARHPEATPEEIQRRLMDLLLGEELARRVYGPLEASQGQGQGR
jgi:hypothetical protein